MVGGQKVLARLSVARHNSADMTKTITILLLLATTLLGCVRRQLEITSEPTGALVYISDEIVGRTPVIWSFDYYGDRDVILRLDGYETLVTHLNLTAPWYEYPGADLLSEIAPWTYEDKRYAHYELTPHVPSSRGDLIKRADEMSRRNNEAVDK